MSLTPFICMALIQEAPRRNGGAIVVVLVAVLAAVVGRSVAARKDKPK